MYPVIFLRLFYAFPFFITPLPFPPQLAVSHSSPLDVNLAFPKGRNSEQLPITFPVATTSQRRKQEYDRCFTSDGRTGICRLRHQCQLYTKYSSGFAETITTCLGDQPLICCPGQRQSWFGHQPNRFSTPSTAVPVGSKANPTFSENVQGLNWRQVYKGNKVNASNNFRNISSGSKISPVSNSANLNVPSKDVSTPLKRVNTTFSSPDDVNVTPASAKIDCGRFDPKYQKSWPWVVSIGRKYSNNTIEWYCLGSLITTEHILTTAHCLQRNPDIVTVGGPIQGNTLGQDWEKTLNYSIADLLQQQKYTHPFRYGNIGLIRLTHRVNVSSTVSPICFPFLAGVLDILEFAGLQTESLGLRRQAGKISGWIQSYERIVHTVINNTMCARSARSDFGCLKENFPKGIKHDSMCVATRDAGTPPEGSPLVFSDPASRSFVVIGVSMGISSCDHSIENFSIFTRVNSFSSWVRDQVGELPTPELCYI